jgi:transposase-like protein
MAEELGIDKNTVCSWVREYRRKNNLPSYAEQIGMVRSEPKSNQDLLYRVKELERELKKSQKQVADEKLKVEILKKSLHIFAQPQE